MNEKIKELAIKAGGTWQGGYIEQANGDSVYTERKFVSGSDLDVEQFAKLILEECMLICGAIQGAGEFKNMSEFASGAAQCKAIIKRDFGIEK